MATAKKPTATTVLKPNKTQKTTSASARKTAIKTIENKKVYQGPNWNVCAGELKPPARKPGRPRLEVDSLFKAVGEKLPYDSLAKVKSALKEKGIAARGVYVAHDSMGCPRYIGRGDIFARLDLRKKAQRLELEYFSFYVVEQKKHEREVETLLIRAAAFLLEFNERKKGWGVDSGDIKDYEAGTVFFEKQYKRGPAKKAA